MIKLLNNYVNKYCTPVVMLSLPPVYVPNDLPDADEVMQIFRSESRERANKEGRSVHDVNYEVIQDWDKQGYVTDEVLARLVTDKLLHIY